MKLKELIESLQVAGEHLRLMGIDDVEVEIAGEDDSYDWFHDSVESVSLYVPSLSAKDAWVRLVR